jgi:hypothetical protein
MPKVYLLSRTFDPLLGIFTGFLAYYLQETNPRSNIAPEHTLRNLIPWQWAQYQAQRQASLQPLPQPQSLPGAGAVVDPAQRVVGAAVGQKADDVDWEVVRKEFESPVEKK